MAKEGWIVAIVKCIVCGKEAYVYLEPKGNDNDEYTGFIVCPEPTCRRAFEVTFSDGESLTATMEDLGSYLPRKAIDVFGE